MNQQSVCIKPGVFSHHVAVIERGTNKIAVVHVIQFIAQPVTFGLFYFAVLNRIRVSEVIAIVSFYDIFVIIGVGAVVSITDFLFRGE